MKTIINPTVTNDGCNIIYNGDIYEVMQDQDGEMYIIDFENENEVIYLAL